jgi:hypothetical protein
MGTYLIEIKLRNSHRNPMELIDIKNEVDKVFNLFIPTLR